MMKKIISILLACLMILPIAIIPAYAEEAEVSKTYDLSLLNKSDVLQPGDIITWDSDEISQYLTITYTSKIPFNPTKDQTSVDLITTDKMIKASLFESPDENLSFAGWKVVDIELKASGTNKLTLSAVWDGDGWDQFVFYLRSFFKPVVRELLSGLLDFIVEIAGIFK